MAAVPEFPPEMSPEDIIAFLTQQPQKNVTESGYEGDEVDRVLEAQIRARIEAGDPYTRAGAASAATREESFVTRQAPQTDDILEIQDFAADVAALDASIAEDMPVSFNEQTRSYEVIDAGFDTDSEDAILEALAAPQEPPPPEETAEGLIERPGQFSVALRGPSEAAPAIRRRPPFDWSVSAMKAASMAAQGIPTQRIVEILARTDDSVSVARVLEWKKSPTFSQRVVLIREQMRRQVLDYLNGNAVMVGRQLLAIIRSGTKNDDVKLRGIKAFFEITGISWAALQKESENEQNRVNSLAGLINWIDADYREVQDGEAAALADSAWVGREVGAEAVAVAVETWEDERLMDARLLNQRVKTPADIAEGLAVVGADVLRRDQRPDAGAVGRSNGVGTPQVQSAEPLLGRGDARSGLESPDGGLDDFYGAAERVAAEISPLDPAIAERLEPVDLDEIWEDPAQEPEIAASDVLVRTVEGLGKDDSLVLYAKSLLQDAKWTVIRRLDPDFEAGYQEKLASRRQSIPKKFASEPRILLIAR